MAAQNRLKLTLAAVMRIRDLYAERAPRGAYVNIPRYSHAEIAKMMDCSETTVFRVVNRLGAYAFVGGESMGEVKADPAADAEMAAASAASLARLQALLAADQSVDDVPDPSAVLTPEMEAKVAAIKAKLGNS